MFASMYKAYETLSDELKEKVEGRTALHSGKHIFGEGPDSYYNTSDAGSHDDGTIRVDHGQLQSASLERRKCSGVELFVSQVDSRHGPT